MSSVGGRVRLGQRSKLFANPKPAGDNFGLEVRSQPSPPVESRVVCLPAGWLVHWYAGLMRGRCPLPHVSQQGMQE